MKYLLIILLSFFAFSCVPHKKLLYLKPEQGNSPNVQSFQADSSFQYRVQPGDVLSIEISSTVASQMEIFNKKFEGKTANSSQETPNSYIIDKSGNIELPLVGLVHVDNMTISEVNKEIKTKLAEYIDYTYVKTRIAGYKISVIGEVRSPGTQAVHSEQLNIFEALSLAGDVTDLGNRKKVKIIRKERSKTNVITLDLSSREIISSPYYNLYPNDIVYVEPLKVKAFKLNTPNITLALSLVTTTLVIITLLGR